MLSLMAKNTSFEGDLTDQGAVRAKLADVVAKIERRERLRDRRRKQKRIRREPRGLKRGRSNPSNCGSCWSGQPRRRLSRPRSKMW